MGYITPSNYLTNNGLFGMREYMLDNTTIDTLNVISGNVFADASVDTCVTVLAKEKKEDSNKSIMCFSKWTGSSLLHVKEKIFNQKGFYDNERYIFTSTEEITIDVPYFELGEMYNVNFGMQLRDRKKYISDVISQDQTDLITEYHKECYTGKDVKRYQLGYSHLLAYVNRIAKSGGCWDETVHVANPKIIVRQIGEQPICCLDDKGFHCLNTVFMITQKENVDISLKYILGVLNSKFIAYYWRKYFYDMRTTFPKIKGSYLKKLPIPKVDTADKRYLDLITLVDNIIELNKRLISVKSESDHSLLVKRISIIDNRIDSSIYKLYSLSSDEIREVEEM